MNINETHISLLTRAFKKDPIFVYFRSIKKEIDPSKKLIRFIIKRNHLLDGLILTDDIKEPSYMAIVDPPSNLRSVSIKSKIKFNIDMFLLIFQLPFQMLRFLTKYQKLTSISAPNEPHYYLTMLGVDPSYQGMGIGKKVLEELHEIAGSSHPAYPVALDTENHKNVAFYERFGYELKDTKVIDGLRVYCMSRPAE